VSTLTAKLLIPCRDPLALPASVTAITRCLKPGFVRSTFNSGRTDAAAVKGQARVKTLAGSGKENLPRNFRASEAKALANGQSRNARQTINPFPKLAWDQALHQLGAPRGHARGRAA
jgi:hypothetical protein